MCEPARHDGLHREGSAHHGRHTRHRPRHRAGDRGPRRIGVHHRPQAGRARRSGQDSRPGRHRPRHLRARQRRRRGASAGGGGADGRRRSGGSTSSSTTPRSTPTSARPSTPTSARCARSSRSTWSPYSAWTQQAWRAWLKDNGGAIAQRRVGRWAARRRAARRLRHEQGRADPPDQAARQRARAVDAGQRDRARRGEDEVRARALREPGGARWPTAIR